MSKGNDELWLIWSNQHDAWWGPHSLGYVRAVAFAGRYSFKEALEICSKACTGNDWTKNESVDPIVKRSVPPDEVMVPSPELLVCLQATGGLKIVGTAS